MPSASPTPLHPPIPLGDLTLHLVPDGGFRLDGGAMFGVVPKVLWERKKPADEKNRIAMTANCLLVERGGDLLLVDCGLGDKLSDKDRAIFALDEDAVRLPEAIRRAGFELGDVTHVLPSHLHFDHCGWSTREANGRLVPTFPEAAYHLARGEVEHARSPYERDAPSYDSRNFEPLFEAGVVELYDAAAEPLSGVRAEVVPGHTRDMAVVLFDGAPPDGPAPFPPAPADVRDSGEDGSRPAAGSERRGTRAVFWADLVPTVAHVPVPWVMGFDLYPVETMDNKRRWLPRAAREGWLGCFVHDPETPLARLVENPERPGRLEAEPYRPGEPAGEPSPADTSA